MQIFAIGDIHGCARALDTLLLAINLGPCDRIVTLGDYINKGPGSRQVLERLVQLHRQGVLVPLRGNHEIKLMRAIEEDQQTIDGTLLVDNYTLASYGRSRQRGSFADIPPSHRELVSRHCRDWWETDHHIFVHANLDPQQPLAEQSQQQLMWTKFDQPQPHVSGKTMVCGHTPQTDGRPLNIGHAICLDTWAHGQGWLSCLEVYSGRLWQANQRRELRTSHIQDYLNCSAA